MQRFVEDYEGAVGDVPHAPHLMENTFQVRALYLIRSFLPAETKGRTASHSVSLDGVAQSSSELEERFSRTPVTIHHANGTCYFTELQRSQGARKHGIRGMQRHREVLHEGHYIRTEEKTA